DLVTATEDWSVRHVIGGIVPRLLQRSDETRLDYTVRHGCFSRAVLSNYRNYDGEHVPALLQRHTISGGDGTLYRGVWLVIDELNRAPVDAAFGSLLTTLGGQRTPLTVPTSTGEVAVPLPRDFRIIGTLNSFDRHFLNQMSEALKRRFVFIDILPPPRSAAAAEQALALYRALLRLAEHGMPGVLAEPEIGQAAWGQVVQVRRTENASVPYTLQISDEQAAPAIYRTSGGCSAQFACIGSLARPRSRQSTVACSPDAAAV
ncbi:MAG: AAA family ATPase, partial [Chloroflexaceae bacterium]|nr:AAA family ATPase [Chloroflexaceae bacterium]